MTNQQLALQKIEAAKKLTALADRELAEGLRLMASPGKKVKAKVYDFSAEIMAMNIKTKRV